MLIFLFVLLYTYIWSYVFPAAKLSHLKYRRQIRGTVAFTAAGNHTGKSPKLTIPCNSVMHTFFHTRPASVSFSMMIIGSIFRYFSYRVWKTVISCYAVNTKTALFLCSEYHSMGRYQVSWPLHWAIPRVRTVTLYDSKTINANKSSFQLNGTALYTRVKWN